METPPPFGGESDEIALQLFGHAEDAGRRLTRLPDLNSHRRAVVLDPPSHRLEVSLQPVRVAIGQRGRLFRENVKKGQVRPQLSEVARRLENGLTYLRAVQADENVLNVGGIRDSGLTPYRVEN
jgi:hypothetical protein